MNGDTPPLGGVAVLELLRARSDGDAPVVVHCTSETDLARALRAGAGACVLKSFDSVTLLAKLSQAGLV